MACGVPRSARDDMIGSTSNRKSGLAQRSQRTQREEDRDFDYLLQDTGVQLTDVESVIKS